MKICPKCNGSPWPFILVFAIASVAGFTTWLTLGLSLPDMPIRVGAGVLAFLTVGATLLHYVLSCLKRHCHHGEEERLARRQTTVPRSG
jgi:hypothetical protein